MTSDVTTIDCVLVCGGRWHDFDRARSRLLGLLGRHPHVRITVSDGYDRDLSAADALVSYTCRRRAEPEQRAAIVDFVARGGRWLALHASNAGTDAEPPGPLTDVLGSRFVSHPPIRPFLVEPTRPDHPLVAGIGPFTVTDELYLCELREPLDVLLHSEVDGEGPRPLLYVRDHGAGQVCYLALGHVDPEHECSWAVPQFNTVLERAVAWAVRA
jgi:type 1 glutamine amidotransferase